MSAPNDPLKVKEKMPCFMMIVNEEGKEVLVNLNQVRVVEKLAADHVRIVFAPDSSITSRGQSAIECLGLCAAYSVLPSGTTFAEVLQKHADALSESQT
jgi:hypothetical protein